MATDAFGVERVEFAKASLPKFKRPGKGVYRSARQAAQAGARTAENTERLTGKVANLVPGRKTAVAIGAGGIAATGGATYGAAYQGTKRGTRAGMSKAGPPVVSSPALVATPDDSAGPATNQDRRKIIRQGSYRGLRTGALAGAALGAGVGLVTHNPVAGVAAGGLGAAVGGKVGMLGGAVKAAEDTPKPVSKSALGDAAALAGGKAKVLKPAIDGASDFLKPKVAGAKDLITPVTSPITSRLGDSIKANPIKAATVAGVAGLGLGAMSGSNQQKINKSHQFDVQDRAMEIRYGSSARAAGGALGARGGRLSKAANSEQQRHRRAGAYEGATAGGAVLAGGAAARTQRQARGAGRAALDSAAAARGSTVSAAGQLKHAMTPQKAGVPNAAKAPPAAIHQLLLQSQGHDKNATEAAQHAFRLARKAKGHAAVAGGLAAGAAAIHHSDRKGRGRSYSYT